MSFKMIHVCLRVLDLEASERFYKEAFGYEISRKKLRHLPYLLCFNNFVVDFKQKTWRNGQPDDYISKSTNIDYIPFGGILHNSYAGSRAYPPT